MRISSRWASGSGGVGSAQHVTRQHPLRQVIGALEAVAAGQGGDPPRPEQVFHRPFAVVPLPPAASPLSALADLGGAERALGGDLGQHLFDVIAPLAGEARHPRPHALEPLRSRHAPAQQRLVLDRDEARPRGPNTRTTRQRRGDSVGIEMGALVRAEPREQRQIMRAHEDIDGIDLQQAELLDERGASRASRA